MGGAGIACQNKTNIHGVNGYCNVYDGAELTESFVNDDTNWGCAPGSPDSTWCPSDRVSSQSTGTDYVGVHIEYTHDWVTGLFGDKKHLTDNVTFRVEPQAP